MVFEMKCFKESRGCVKHVLSIGTLNFILIWSFLNSTSAHYIQISDAGLRDNIFSRPRISHKLPTIEEIPEYSHAKKLTASEFMTDLTNDLTYRILHYHSILNRNNFALSPTALMSIMVALYEGSAGRSAIEIRNVLKLPNNRDIVRVGYRDIHRKLRTYFFGSDNPLKGLSLNKENVTISTQYETILMFYGYDLGMDMVSSTTMAPKIEMNETSSTEGQESLITESQADIVTTGTSNKKEVLTTMTTENQKETTTEMSTTVATTDMNDETTTSQLTESEKEEVVPADQGTEEIVSAFVADANVEPLLRIEKARISRLPMINFKVSDSLQKVKSNYLPTLITLNSTSSKMLRQKRNTLGYNDFHSNLFISLYQPTNELPFLFPIAQSSFSEHINVPSNLKLGLQTQFVSSGETRQNYNTDIISHVFYLSNQQTVYTTYKVYNAVLYYKYIESIKMNVLELELDTLDYNLMILLPEFHTDMVSASDSLRFGPNLRRMRKQLKPRWVQAIIPDFQLHGTMFLTNDLQNMGIFDIFEPNRANFGTMTDEKGIYVKHIEQFINIHIRTHPINHLKRNTDSTAQPIQISVNHPFLFFIVDRELDIAVMAGRILNPLNVRIQ